MNCVLVPDFLLRFPFTKETTQTWMRFIIFKRERDRLPSVMWNMKKVTETISSLNFFKAAHDLSVWESERLFTELINDDKLMGYTRTTTYLTNKNLISRTILEVSKNSIFVKYMSVPTIHDKVTPRICLVVWFDYTPLTIICSYQIY